MGFFKKMVDLVTTPHGVLDLRLESNIVSRGESLKGVLLFSANETFISNMVRCEIECVELFQNIQMTENGQQRLVVDNRVLYSAKTQLQGQKSYRKGQKISLPFAILIPDDSSPTLKKDVIQDTWTIKGVVAVDGRPDITTLKIPFEVLA